uniref:Uncharacterized protein n=1 Tax=Anguilla anguilla TaxID=7936 RepID=A0A0E9WTJ6_ANGAN
MFIKSDDLKLNTIEPSRFLRCFQLKVCREEHHTCLSILRKMLLPLVTFSPLRGSRTQMSCSPHESPAASTDINGIETLAR